MEFTKLGDTGVDVPEIGLGVWQYRGGIEPLRRGLDLGAFLIDTAENYGTEDVVGQAIEGQRDRVFLATKVSGNHLRREELLRAADSSLRRLRVDYVDLYQVHWPDSRVPIGDTMSALEDLADAGKVRFIGVSNFSRRELEEAQASMRKHRIVCNQVLYNLNDREIEDDLLPYCQRNKVTVMAYSPLARGDLASKSLLRRGKAEETLRLVAEEVGKSMAQVALNWCLSRPRVIAIPKSNHVQRVEENCGASGWRLSPDQVATLDQAYR